MDKRYKIQSFLFLFWIILIASVNGQSLVSPELREPLTGDSVMHHVMSRASWYSHIVGEYRADLYVRGHLKVYRRNPLLRVVPSMFRFEKGVKDYIIESKNQMHYSAPDIYDVKVQALTGTFRRNNGEIGNIMEFFNINIYSTDLLPDKLISPFSENSHKYYYYLR